MSKKYRVIVHPSLQTRVFGSKSYWFGGEQTEYLNLEDAEATCDRLNAKAKTREWTHREPEYVVEEVDTAD